MLDQSLSLSYPFYQFLIITPFTNQTNNLLLQHQYSAIQLFTDPLIIETEKHTDLLNLTRYILILQ